MVHVAIFLYMGVGNYGGRWGHNFKCRGQHFFSYHIPVYFDATVHATGPINTHRVIFSDVLYEIIYMLFLNIFYPKVINNQ